MTEIFCSSCFESRFEECKDPVILTKKSEQDVLFCENCGHCIYDISLPEELKYRPDPGKYLDEKKAIELHVDCLKRIRKASTNSSSPPGGLPLEEKKIPLTSLGDSAPLTPKDGEEEKEGACESWVTNEMMVTFKTLTGRSFEVLIPENWTTTDLIFAIGRFVGCVKNARLIFSGRVIQMDDKKLSDIGMISGSIVHIILSLRGS